MSVKTIKNADGTKTQQWIETPQNIYWRQCWQNAWNAMPRHSATLLCKLLGYNTISQPKGWNSANSRIYANYTRGSIPAKPEQQRLLRMLGGIHGDTIAKAIAIQRGIPFK